MGEGWVLLISCEHAGYKIPKVYIEAIDKATQALLPTHRGWDRGALDLAKTVSKAENAPLFFTEISRLLIDCNRSLHHPQCLGPNFRDGSPTLQEQIAHDYYHPYRNSISEAIERLHKKGSRVLHCAFHSFTPVLNGDVRQAELGLLYDPSRQSEREWAVAMMQVLRDQNFPGRVRRNYPYRGRSDGLTRCLRQRFATDVYAGFEIEFNQRLFESAGDGAALARGMLTFFAALALKR